MMHYYYGPGAGFGFGGAVISFMGIVLWALLIWGLFMLIFGRHRLYSHWHDRHHDHADTPEPLELAKARYAKGDITKTEFEQIKKDLSD